MPFIKPEKRKYLAEGGEPLDVGDLCYMAYVQMVEDWTDNPRWTTAHNIYKRLWAYLPNTDAFNRDDLDSATGLAWQVFFQKYVMPYEEQKIKENGDI